MNRMQFIYTMKGLGKVHPPDARVLNDIWLSFLPGAKIGVLGLNGAGKSTLLRIMAGVDEPSSGDARPAKGIRIGWTQHEEIRFVLDSARGVAWRLVEVDDDAIARIHRIDLTAKHAPDALVRAGLPESRTGSKWLDRLDRQRDEARAHRGAHQQEEECACA